MITDGSGPPTGDMPDGKEPPPERTRRQLSEDILRAFHYACDTKNLEVARQLLALAEKLSVKRDGRQLAELAPLVAAHERLWELQKTKD